MTRLRELEPRVLCLGHAFQGGTLINAPVRSGPGARAFLQTSVDVADTIHRAVAAVMQMLSKASKRQIALAALAELLYEIPQLRLRSSGMPQLAGPTLLAHIEAVKAGNYPV